MDEPLLRVHGSIFFLLRKFVIQNYSLDTWDLILENSGLKGHVYDITRNYRLSEMDAIIDGASVLTKLSVYELKEKFGEYMVPDLLVMYHSYLNPSWRTFELVEHTERVMHGAVRSLNSTANPPILNVTRVNDRLLMIDYHSKRKMGSLAIGIIRGIAIFFKEQDSISVSSISNPEDERVQIKVISMG